MKTLLRALVILLAVLAGCARKPEVVRLAVAAPLTGDLGSEGRGLARAVDLALEEANASGRFPYTLELAPFDDRGDPEEAVKVAHIISSDPLIAAVIGHRTSGCAVAAAPVYARAGIPMISPSATNPEVTLQQLKPGWAGPKVVFRVVPTDDVQGAFAAQFLYERLGKRRMAVAHDGTLYGRGLAERFKKTYAELGGKIVSHEAIAAGGKDFGALISGLKATAPDGLFFGGYYREASLILKQMRSAGVKAAFVSGDGAKMPALFKVAGKDADGAYLTFVGPPVESLPHAQPFLEAYRRRWDGADEDIKSKDHFAYECARIALDALKQAGPGDRTKLLAALRRTSHEGLLGLTTFDENGDTLNRTVTMTRARFSDKSFEVLASPGK